MSIPLFCNGLRGTELSLNPSCYDTRHGLRLSTEKKYNLILPRRMRQAATEILLIEPSDDSLVPPVRVHKIRVHIYI